MTLDGIVEGLRGVLRPGGVVERVAGAPVLWVWWRTYGDDDRDWLEDTFGRPVPLGTIDLTYKAPDWRELFALVERLATATRGTVYLDGSLPGPYYDLVQDEDLALAVTGNGLPYDRWPALAKRLLDAIEAKSGT